MSEEVWIELRALRVQARIGVEEEEREVERPLLIDLDLIPKRSGATASDEVGETVDYSTVAAIAERVATEAPHRTLERVAARIAEAVMATGEVAEVGVRVAKPEPPMPQTVESVAVRLARSGE